MGKFFLFLGIFTSFLAQAIEFDSTLIGGRRALNGEFPEIIYIRSGGAACSASVVGPRVILTAAHCTRDNGEIVPLSETLNYHFTINQEVFKARCTIAPEYRNQVGDQDMAYCKTNKDVDVKWATISREGPKKGEVVYLAGYGGTIKGGGGGNDGVLRVGKAPVTKESTSSYYSYETTGSTALNFGDSGGPSMKNMIDPTREVHVILGVNSRGDIQERSLLTAVYHPKSIKFAEDFERENDVMICGISLDCGQEQGPKDPNKCIDEFNKAKKYFNKLEQCMFDRSNFPSLPAV